jgi:hypothetical protein
MSDESDREERLMQMRSNVVDMLLAASQVLFTEGNPRCKAINDLGMQAFDAFCREYPYAVQHELFITYLTIGAAIYSSLWTIQEQ